MGTKKANKHTVASPEFPLEHSFNISHSRADCILDFHILLTVFACSSDYAKFFFLIRWDCDFKISRLITVVHTAFPAHFIFAVAQPFYPIWLLMKLAVCCLKGDGSFWRVGGYLHFSLVALFLA